MPCQAVGHRAGGERHQPVMGVRQQPTPAGAAQGSEVVGVSGRVRETQAMFLEETSTTGGRLRAPGRGRAKPNRHPAIPDRGVGAAW